MRSLDLESRAGAEFPLQEAAAVDQCLDIAGERFPCDLFQRLVEHLQLVDENLRGGPLVRIGCVFANADGSLR